MTTQEEDCLSNQTKSWASGFSNTMVDDIVHNKMQEFINQMGPFYQAPSEEESVNDKNRPRNIYTLTSANYVIM